MALLTNNYETIYGIDAKHWVIDTISTNEKYQYAELNLSGYISEESYLNKCTPIKTQKVKINWNDGFENLFSKKAKTNKNIYELAYEYVKQNVKEFKDAIDC